MKIRIGDRIRHKQWDGTTKEGVIECIEICEKGEKYGNKARTADTETDWGVVDISDGHWCYFSEITDVFPSSGLPEGRVPDGEFPADETHHAMKIVVLNFVTRSVDIINVSGVHPDSADEFLASHGWDISQIEWFILEGDGGSQTLDVNVHYFGNMLAGQPVRNSFGVQLDEELLAEAGRDEAVRRLNARLDMVGSRLGRRVDGMPGFTEFKFENPLEVHIDHAMTPSVPAQAISVQRSFNRSVLVVCRTADGCLSVPITEVMTGDIIKIARMLQ